MSRSMTRPNESSQVGRLYEDPFQTLESRMNQLFRGMMDSVGSGETGLGVYPVDVVEDDEGITIEAELPGFKSDEIDLNVANGVLTIKAERQAQGTDDKKKKRHMTERRYTRVQRAFTLPRTVEGSDVEAHLEHGLLTIHLKKTEESKPRKIEIRNSK